MDRFSAEVPVRVAVVRALTDWYRNAAALALVAGTYGVAATLGTSIAFFAAGLVVFTVWMAWFVMTVVDALRLLGV